MSNHLFVVSEWLPKKNHKKELWDHFKKLMALTLEKESGCISARATKQINHPGSPGKSKYTIMLMQEYESIEAFDEHCSSEYVSNFFETYIENDLTSIVEDWTCRLFSEEE